MDVSKPVLTQDRVTEAKCVPLSFRKDWLLTIGVSILVIIIIGLTLSPGDLVCYGCNPDGTPYEPDLSFFMWTFVLVLAASAILALIAIFLPKKVKQ